MIIAGGACLKTANNLPDAIANPGPNLNSGPRQGNTCVVHAARRIRPDSPYQLSLLQALRPNPHRTRCRVLALLPAISCLGASLTPGVSIVDSIVMQASEKPYWKDPAFALSPRSFAAPFRAYAFERGAIGLVRDPALVERVAQNGLINDYRIYIGLSSSRI
jgi:hypothetical protein